MEIVAALPRGPIAEVVRILLRSTRGPGFQSGSGCVFFFSLVTFCGSESVRAQTAGSKGTASFVPVCFRADSVTTLVKKHGEMVASLLCGPIAQCSGY